jgi:hypothetical protein
MRKMDLPDDRIANWARHGPNQPPGSGLVFCGATRLLHCFPGALK